MKIKHAETKQRFADLYAFAKHLSDDGYDEEGAVLAVFEYLSAATTYAPWPVRQRLLAFRRRAERVTAPSAAERFRLILLAAYGQLCGHGGWSATAPPRNYAKERAARVEAAKARVAAGQLAAKRHQQDTRDKDLAAGLQYLSDTKSLEAR